ncbi:MAG: hypothetical protein AAB539_02720 [Patescibacteria group bacterium]
MFTLFPIQSKTRRIAAAVVLLIAVAAVSLYRWSESASRADRGAAFVLETMHIAQLPPHAHEPSLNKLHDAGHGVFLGSDAYVATEDFWITEFRWDVRNAPLVVLHHSTLQRLDETDGVCPIFYQELITGALDANYAPVIFPEPYGMFVASGTPLMLHAIVHNPFPPYGPGGFYRDVSAALRMRVERAATGRRSRRVEYQRLRIDDTPCAYAQDMEGLRAPNGVENIGLVLDDTFAIPARSDHAEFRGARVNGVSTAEYTFRRPGALLGFGGHLHGWEGGEKLIVSLNGRRIAQLITKKRASPPWEWETQQLWTRRRIRPGDIISIAAIYSNPSGKALLGASMGMLGFYFAPD